MAERTERGVLEHLVEICRDGERGFRAAAEYVSTPELKALFTQLAEQRQAFAHDLEPHVNRLGGSALASGTGAGAVHRGWMNLKAHVPGHHDQTIISETERGEGAPDQTQSSSGVPPLQQSLRGDAVVPALLVRDVPSHRVSETIVHVE